MIYYFCEINYKKEMRIMKTGINILKMAGKVSAKFIIWLADILKK